MLEVILVECLLVKLKFMPNQYENVGNSVSHLGQVASQIALGLAQQRNQQAQAQQMMQLKLREQAMQEAIARQRGELMGQQGKQAESVAGWNQQRTGDLARKAGSQQQFSEALRGMSEAQRLRNAPLGEGRLRSMAMGAAGALAALGNQDVMKNLAQAMFLMQGGDNANTALALGGVRNAYVNTPQGSTSVSPFPGMASVIGQADVAPEHVRFGPQVAPNVDPNGVMGGTNNVPMGVGGPKAQNPNDYLKVLQSITGSFANVRNAGLDPFGKPSDINNPAYKAADSGLPIIMGEIMNRLTNAPPATVAPSGNTRVGLQGGPTQFASPKSQAEFDALPSGSLYINPADGKQYRKN